MDAADAAATTTGAEKQDVATSSLGVVPRALVEGRCPSVVHRATAVAVVLVGVSSGEVDRPMFSLAYTCKPKPQSFADSY